MVMVPVPGSQTLIAIPVSSLNQFEEKSLLNSEHQHYRQLIMEAQIQQQHQQSHRQYQFNHNLMPASIGDEQDEKEARELLRWDNGIGILDGCDLRFRINQLGCLELIDSDEESENRNYHQKQSHETRKNVKSRENNKKCKTSPSSSSASSATSPSNNVNVDQTSSTGINIDGSSSATTTTSNITTTTTNCSQSAEKTTDVTSSFNHQHRQGRRSSNETVANSKQDLQPTLLHQQLPLDLSNESNPNKRVKCEHTAGQVRQISPGSSLLRDGPNTRRPKSASCFNPPGLSLLKKLELNQQSILLDKIIPKARIEEIKPNVGSWTVDDVKDFVDSIPGCEGFGQLFETQQICGKAIVHLDQKELVEIVGVKLGPAIKIFNAISLIK